MKILFYFKNLEVSEIVKAFFKKQISKIKKFLPQEENWVEIELKKDKEVKFKKGLFKTKIMVTISKSKLIVAEGEGKDIFASFSEALDKLKREIQNTKLLKRIRN
jgi:ribosomal subunit interface protein